MKSFFVNARMSLHIAVEKLKVMGNVLRNQVTVKFHLIIYMLGFVSTVTGMQIFWNFVY
jgi:hypothetical protein